MEEKTRHSELLDFLVTPAFVAVDNVISYTNSAAKAAMLSVGDPVAPLLATGAEEFYSLKEGSLFLSLHLMGTIRGASVHCRGDACIFVAEETDTDPGLRLMSLAAVKLREPLNDIMAVTDQMFPELMGSEDPERQRQMAQVNRALYRILRTVGNMSDAGGYLSTEQMLHLEPTELGGFYNEIFQKADALGEAAQIQMTYTCPPEDVNAMVDRQKLERATYNLLSNAMKFTPKGGFIHMELEAHGDLAVLKISDNGEGVPVDMLSTVYDRFRREPAVGDVRWGIGLGLPMVTRTATLHGGALLMKRREGGGTVVAMSIRQGGTVQKNLSTPMRLVDYTGEHDHGLVELADCLPWAVFEAGGIN